LLNTDIPPVKKLVEYNIATWFAAAQSNQSSKMSFAGTL
jgi:hypothetical protein